MYVGAGLEAIACTTYKCVQMQPVLALDHVPGPKMYTATVCNSY